MLNIANFFTSIRNSNVVTNQSNESHSPSLISNCLSFSNNCLKWKETVTGEQNNGPRTQKNIKAPSPSSCLVFGPRNPGKLPSFILSSSSASPVFLGESDSLVLSSGNGGTDTDGRKWGADSKYLDAKNSITSTAAFQDPSLSSVIPYMTARIFPSEASYKFPVKSTKRYWLRLHFYPSAYSNFNAKDSYFSVTANTLTLLKNFSASITCQALSQAYIVREYSLAPLESETLTVVFKPSNNHPGAFAFVNGIEVIPMPELFDAATVVGSPTELDVKSLTTETMYRLNVGGQYISPANDSGLTRAWYDDLPYLLGAATGVTNSASPKLQIQYQGRLIYYAEQETKTFKKSDDTKVKVIGGAAGGAAAFGIVAAICVVDGSSHSSQGQESDDTSEESLRNRNMAMHYRNLNIGSEHEGSDESSESSAIFSQIVNPKGR
ncbi:hypothetical protein FH972_006402 [Carpinus fangiana]|uniref:Malectin-like domain-containing protein n=1 Tax=Carpinus fangiana TaxID=176857 RepID=A0A5N6QSI1_9ROSI|nr:hypothetical protein FH972_006402 [Carpinus fangiana]